MACGPSQPPDLLGIPELRSFGQRSGPSRLGRRSWRLCHWPRLPGDTARLIPLNSGAFGGRWAHNESSRTAAGYGQRETGYQSEGAANQPRRQPLRHVRRNRRGAGGRALVLPGGRRGRHGGQDHLRLRHGGQRRDLRPDGLLRQPAASAAMLDYEYDLLLERLDKTRGGKTAFFVFANTVATRREDGNGAGWGFASRPSRVPTRRRSSFTCGCSTRRASASRRRWASSA